MERINYGNLKWPKTASLKSIKLLTKREMEINKIKDKMKYIFYQKIDWTHIRFCKSYNIKIMKYYIPCNGYKFINNYLISDLSEIVYGYLTKKISFEFRVNKIERYGFSILYDDYYAIFRTDNMEISLDRNGLIGYLREIIIKKDDIKDEIWLCDYIKEDILLNIKNQIKNEDDLEILEDVIHIYYDHINFLNKNKYIKRTRSAKYYSFIRA